MRLSDAMYSAVLYGDIFSYPYTQDELRRWTPYCKNIFSVDTSLKHLLKKKKLAIISEYITLPKRKNIIKIRENRMQIAKKKWEIAQKAGHVLRCIPTILMVGVTGGLAMDNADSSDDIDICIMTDENTLWVTRFFATILIELSMKRRRPDEKQVRDAICLNMYFSKKGARMIKSKHDMYTAHEVLQMKPLWERRNAYKIFLAQNSWVKSIFPLQWEDCLRRCDRGKKENIYPFFDWIMRICDFPLKNLQVWYMRKRKTGEVVSDEILQFHPHDARGWVLRTLQQKMRSYHIHPLTRQSPLI